MYKITIGKAPDDPSVTYPSFKDVYEQTVEGELDIEKIIKAVNNIV